jgi:flagellar biosynthesis anti-sigma factor FlgM
VPDAPFVVSEGREAARRMASEPPVDTKRVAELRDAIASGRYRIDPDRIADAMLRSEPGLLRG